MDDKYPDQDMEQEAHDLDPERAGRRAPPDGDTPALAGGVKVQASMRDLLALRKLL